MSSKRSKWLRINWTRIGSTFRLKSPKHLPEKLNSWKDGQTTVVSKHKDNIVRMTIFPFWTADSEQNSWKSELPLCRNWLSKPKIISRYANRPSIARKIFKKNKVGGLSTLKHTTNLQQSCSVETSISIWHCHGKLNIELPCEPKFYFQEYNQGERLITLT